MFDRLRAKLRYALALRAFLREKMGREEACRLIEERFRQREESFLKTCEATVYSNPNSPYLKLLRQAGVELADLRRLVSECGLEGALEQLYDAGVYITLEEFKGRQPIRRNGSEFTVTRADFDNPLVAGNIERQSSGSRGVPSIVRTDFDYLTIQASYAAAFDGAEEGRPLADWRVGSATSSDFYLAKLGRGYQKKFSLLAPKPGVWAAISRNLHHFGNGLLGLARARQEFVSRENVVTIPRWLAEQKDRGTPAVMAAGPSAAIRTCLSAKEHGLDISGTTFRMSGEPYTPAKAGVIESVGANAHVRYSMTELVGAGHGCQAPAELDEVHLYTDKLAVIQRDHTAPSGARVGALYFTQMIPAGPKLMINVESGDYGVLFQRDCGCLVGKLGFATHLSGIRSYEKLTSESVTFLGSELYDLLEEELPRRFGGHVNDYQLVEEEEGAESKVSIVVAPSVGEVDEDAILEAVFNVLRRSRVATGPWSEMWRQTGTLRVVRREPYATRTAKILPLHVLAAAKADTPKVT